MNPFTRCFLGTLIMTILVACAYHDVTVSWDETTQLADGTALNEENQEVRYNVYIDYNIDPNHKSMLLLTKDGPIKETSYTMHHAKAKGHYLVGIEAVLYENGAPVVNSDLSSFAWSNSKKDTNEKPFDVDIAR
ncbi:hypothetical protein P9J64_16980 [Deltaproteobacteria bacterium IMCC39524]|nr:hypothetical protein [Deltaproteobacteria bacterium IMCC39524]